MVHLVNPLLWVIWSFQNHCSQHYVVLSTSFRKKSETLTLHGLEHLRKLQDGDKNEGPIMGQGWQVGKEKGRRPGKMGHLGSCLRPAWYKPNKPMGGFTLPSLCSGTAPSCTHRPWGHWCRYSYIFNLWFKRKDLGLSVFYLSLLAGNLTSKS